MPKLLFCDSGSEFTSPSCGPVGLSERNEDRLRARAKPTDNAFVESFNGTFRAECLNAPWFGTLAEAKRLIEAWRQEY